MSMTGYVEGDIYEYQQKIQTHPQYATQEWEQPDYGAKYQWVHNKSDKTILPPDNRIYIHKLVGDFSYYVRSVGPTILVVVGTLAAAQSKLTKDTK